MQVIWKGSTELGIGKADGKKNGRRYTYIVARYRPAISFDTLNNVLKGKFTPSYCGGKPAFSLSDSDQTKPTPKVRRNPTGKLSTQPSVSPNGPTKFRLSKPASSLSDSDLNKPTPKVRRNPTGKLSTQPSVSPNGPTKFRLLFGQTLTKQPIRRLGWKETRDPVNNARPIDAKYGKANLKITSRYPYGQGQQSDKQSYYAGNSWGANQETRMPTPLSEYYPKQAEVLEEFIEGDDPAEKAKYEQTVNNDDIVENGENGGFNQTLIPLMNSEDAEIEDDSSEDELATKSHVPKHKN